MTASPVEFVSQNLLVYPRLKLAMAQLGEKKHLGYHRTSMVYLRYLNKASTISTTYSVPLHPGLKYYLPSLTKRLPPPRLKFEVKILFYTGGEGDPVLQQSIL